VEAVKTKREMNEEEKEALIEEFLPFIKYTAYRLSWRMHPQLSVEDLISVGIMGLLDALKRYKEGIVKINTFVEFRIKGAMLDELRSSEWIPKSMKKKINSIKKAHAKLEQELGRLPEDDEIADNLEMPLEEYYRILQNSSNAIAFRIEDFGDRTHNDNGMDITECIADPEAKSPLAILEESKNKEILAGFIAELPEKEKLILSLYYWEEMTMKEIGKTLNLTEGRVSQLHNQALIRLKAKVEG
jgi:RNA polymerase sigma factor FliA